MFHSICIPIKSSSPKSLITKIEQASPKADIIELWLGELAPEEIDWEKIFSVKKTPYLLNVKGEKEHGNFTGTDEEKLGILLEGAKRGAEYIDLDYEFPAEGIQMLQGQECDTQLILSAHFFEGTPSLPSLLNRVKKMQSLGADIVKIAAMANSEKDLITILRLAENLHRQGQKYIAIAMGRLGKISRISTPLLGGEMMFAALGAEGITAEGQMTVEEMKKVWEILMK